MSNDKLMNYKLRKNNKLSNNKLRRKLCLKSHLKLR